MSQETSTNNAFFSFITGPNLILKIIIGIVLGSLVGAFIPETAKSLSFLGGLFVSALKALAPILIFVLVIASLATQNAERRSGMRPILVLYFIGTMSAATTAVMLSFLFPANLVLVAEASNSAPQGIGEVLNTLLFKIVDNPINALLNANYIGILAWAIGLGLLWCL